jgi:hypothetical protein
MKRFQTFGAALLAVFALAAVAVATASAATPEALSEFPNTFTGTSGAGALEQKNGSLAIQCSSDKSSGSLTSSKAGTYAIDFEGCKTSLGGECHSEGDLEKIILVSGTFSIVYVLKPPTTHTGILFLLSQFHITCIVGGLTTLVLVRTHNGGVLGLIEPVNTKTKAFKINVTKAAKGVQSETAYWTSATSAETKEVWLESAVNAGAFEQSSEESAANNVTFAKELTIDA